MRAGGRALLEAHTLRKQSPQGRAVRPSDGTEVPIVIYRLGLDSYFKIVYGLRDITPDTLGYILGKSTTDKLHPQN